MRGNVNKITHTNSNHVGIFEKLNFFNICGMFGAILTEIDKVIAEHKATYSENNIRDFTDCCLKQIAQSDENPQAAASNLRQILFDLFMAGSETTSSNLQWVVYYMVKYPDIQRKVQTEIDAVTGIVYHYMHATSTICTCI